MNVIRLPASAAARWIARSIKNYPPAAGIWSGVGVLVSLVSLMGTLSDALSVLFLFLEPLFVGTIIYIAWCLTRSPILPVQSIWRVMTVYFWRFVGMGVLLVLLTAVVDIVALLITVKSFSALGWLHTNMLSVLAHNQNLFSLASVVVSSDQKLILVLVFLVLMMVLVLVQACALYAPILLMSQEIGYHSQMTVLQCIFSSVVGTMVNWLPLLINSLLLMGCLAGLVLLLLCVGMILNAAIALFVMLVVGYCVVFPIMSLNILASFSDIFQDSVSPQPPDSQPVIEQAQ